MNLKNAMRTKNIPLKRQLEHVENKLVENLEEEENDSKKMKKEKPEISNKKNNSKKNEKNNNSRYDNISHWPVHDTKKSASRCKNENCKQFTHVYCEKCDKHLCFTSSRNCFKDYHMKNQTNSG